MDPEIAKKRKAEIEQWEKTHAEAKEKDWLANHKGARRAQAKGIETCDQRARDGKRRKESDRSKGEFGELPRKQDKGIGGKGLKCREGDHQTQARIAKKTLEAEKERHEKTIKACQEDFARMIKVQEDLIETTEEELRKAKEEYEEADIKINTFMAKQFPTEPSITPAMLDTQVITAHLLKDEKLAGILDLQAEGVAKSLCSLLNLIVANKSKEDDEEESDMDLDANELAAAGDHEQAVRQMDGEGGSSSSTQRGGRRKLRGKRCPADAMDQTALAAGKRDANAAETEQPPPPKCPTKEPTK